MLNHINIMGRIAKEVKICETRTGRKFIRNSIACDRDGTRGDDKITDWIDISAWGKTAEFIGKYFQKGDPILLEGSIRSSTWVDASGNKRYGVEILIDSAYFCGSKRRESGPTEVQTDEAFDDAVDFLDSDNDDEIPF